MSKKPIIGGIILAAIIGVVFAGAQINPDNPENEKVWSIRMAGPEWDDRPIHRASLPNLEEGTYKLGFVPMGDSPSPIKIDIEVRSAGSDFAEEIFRADNLPALKHLLQTDIFKFIPTLGKINFIETFVKKQTKPQEKTTVSAKTESKETKKTKKTKAP